MNADADLIAVGLLLEIKTSLGRKHKDGTRFATLDRQTILQLVGYTLLDFSDSFGIIQLGLYSARYAHLVTWKLNEFLDELARGKVDLAVERAVFQEVLLAGPTSNSFDTGADGRTTYPDIQHSVPGSGESPSEEL